MHVHNLTFITIYQFNKKLFQFTFDHNTKKLNPMKRITFLLSYLLLTLPSFSQNLVQNGDFEELNNEPCGLTMNASDFDNNMLYWVVANTSTPDIFLTSIDQACWNFQPNSTYPGPIGLKGPQDPHSGAAFVGIFGYTIPEMNQRDYIQVQLSSPMVSGTEYIVEFYVSLADNTELTIDNMGAYLSTNAIFTSNDGVLDFEAQVQFDSHISDIDNWVRVADTITAGDNYEYITIGNFNNDATTTTEVNPDGAGCIGCYGAYYFVDDVSITAVTALGINDPIQVDFSVYPNPFTSTLNIRSENTLFDTEFNILDASGKIVHFQNAGEGESFQLDLSTLARGIYFLEINHTKGSQTQHIVKMN